MKSVELKNTVLASEKRINFVTLNQDGTFTCEAVNRESRTTKCNYKNYKTIRGAVNCLFAKQNGGVNVLIEPNGTDWSKATVTTL